MNPSDDYAAWRQAAERALKGKSLESLNRSLEELSVRALYDGREARPRPAALAARPHRPDWKIARRHDSPDHAQAARAIREDLEGGADGIEIVLDLASRDGLDASHPDGRALLARGGLHLRTIADLDRLLADREMASFHIGFDAGAASSGVFALLVGRADQRGVPRDQLRGALNFDPINTLLSEGFLLGSVEEAMANLADLASWSSKHCPQLSVARASSRGLHESGASAAQEIAFTLATGLAYLRVMRTLPIEAALRQVVLELSATPDVFLTIAKLRAARVLWGKVAQVCGVEPSSCDTSLNAFSSRRTMTRFDPWTNILRGTAACFAAATGGADGITVETFDRPIAAFTDKAQRLARNTQLVLREESDLVRVDDPAGGAWFIEHLTAEIGERAWTLFQEVEAAGGMLEALGSGLVHGHVARAREHLLARVENGSTRLVGTTAFPKLDEGNIERDGPSLLSLVEELVQTTPEPPELPPFASIDDQVEQAAAGGALSALIDAQYEDRSTESKPLPSQRVSERFEEIRERSLSEGTTVLAVPVRSGRIYQELLRFARDFFEIGGIEVREAGESSEGSRVALLIADDDDVVPALALARILKAKGVQKICAVSPATTSLPAELRHVHRKSPLYATLAWISREDG